MGKKGRKAAIDDFEADFALDNEDGEQQALNKDSQPTEDAQPAGDKFTLAVVALLCLVFSIMLTTNPGGPASVPPPFDACNHICMTAAIRGGT
jgi:hypothetical protein